jgi:glycosyltransferase involved in cell wall biosynthesis
MTEAWERTPIATSPISAVPLGEALDPGLPAFLEALTAALNGLDRPCEILLVNDGGSDEQRAAAEQRTQRFAPVRWLHHDQALGPGACLRTALAAAQHPLFLTVPVGEGYRPEELSRLLTDIDQADVVCGYRGGRSWLRTWFTRWLGKWSFGLHVIDPTCPFRLYRRDLFGPRIPLQSRGRFVHIEILAKANFLGKLFAEAELTWQPAGPEPRAGRDAWFWSDAWQLFRQPDFGPARIEGPGTTVPAEPSPQPQS